MLDTEIVERLTALDKAHETLNTRDRQFHDDVSKMREELRLARNEVGQLKDQQAELRTLVDKLKGHLGSTHTEIGELRNEAEQLKSSIEELEARPGSEDGASRNKIRKALKANPPRFDGKDDHFRTWLADYKSFARKHGFLFALEESKSVPIGSSVSDEALIDEGYDPDLVVASRDAFFSLREACNDTTYRATVAAATSAPEMLQMLTEYYQVELTRNGVYCSVNSRILSSRRTRILCPFMWTSIVSRTSSGNSAKGQVRKLSVKAFWTHYLNLTPPPRRLSGINRTRDAMQSIPW